MVLKAPCYQCGKPAVIDGLCASCYNQSHPLIEIDTPLTLTVCKRCGAVKVPGGWKTIESEDSQYDEILFQQLRALLDQELQVRGESVEIMIEKQKELDGIVHIVVNARGQSHPLLPPHENSIDVEVRFVNAVCDTCSMMSGGYHELILQIRAEDRMVTKKEEQEILSLITERTIAEYGKDTKAFVTSIDSNRFGLDILIGSEHLGRKIADELESVFLASRKENYKLIGQERNGKKKYRLTIVLRLPQFSIGDFVEINEKPCQVLSMGRSGLKCYDLIERSEFTVTPKSAKWRTLRYLASESELRPNMVVSIDYNGTVQLMDSESYELFELNQDVLGNDIQQGDTIKVIHLDDQLYVVPTIKDAPER
jgi:nonsense-mediated mRNA decay protein 3